MIPAITFVIQFPAEHSFMRSFRESFPSPRLLTHVPHDDSAEPNSLFLSLWCRFDFSGRRNKSKIGFSCRHRASLYIQAQPLEPRLPCMERIRFHALKRSRQHFPHQPEEEPELEPQSENTKPPKPKALFRSLPAVTSCIHLFFFYFSLSQTLLGPFSRSPTIK